MEAGRDMVVELDLAQRISERVLYELELEPVELEFSLMVLEPLVELAAGGEVVPIDLDDPAGGFGGVDWVLKEIFCEQVTESSEDLLARALPKVEQSAARTGSPRAADRLPELIEVIRRVVPEYLIRTSTAEASHGAHDSLV